MKIALFHAAPIAALLLGLIYGWFAIANRYHIFLYNHLGATPFDEVTRSRYWMAGLVAAGLVLVLYTPVNWVIGRLAGTRGRVYIPPAWWRVWLICLTPLTIGILLITMTCNAPTLPLTDALAVLAAALLGLALALWPNDLAARRPGDLIWLLIFGLGLVPSLLLLRAVELPGRGLSVPVWLVYTIAIVGTLAGAVWLVGLSWLRVKLGRSGLTIGQLLWAGCAWSYLLLPLVHHILATPPEFRYISTASNFFAFSPVIQLLSWAMAAALALGSAQLQQKLQAKNG
jgi:hypothetical protein